MTKKLFLSLNYILLALIFTANLNARMFKTIIKAPKEVLEALINEDKDIVNAFDIDHRTLLHHATFRRNEDVMKLLLDKGADVNAEDSIKRTPLHYAASNATEKVVTLLLNNKANVSAKDFEARTPLFYAARFNGAIVNLLLEKGADVNVADKNGNTPLHFACASMSSKIGEIVKLMLNKGAHRTAKNKKNQIPLHLAVKSDNKAAVASLLKNSFEINQMSMQDEYGKTPVHYASNAKILKLLLQQSNIETFINIQDNNGRTPLLGAYFDQDQARIELLLQYGADATIKDNEGLTPAELLKRIRIMEEHEIKEKELRKLKEYAQYDTLKKL